MSWWLWLLGGYLLIGAACFAALKWGTPKTIVAWPFDLLELSRHADGFDLNTVPTPPSRFNIT